ncbi:T9SS type A sorting domain-containing protein, partial [candidate division WOR-3 bacterium]|nr:T9SS type A sorting domain-containing protein [candidate division WOR-3 bacterium]
VIQALPGNKWSKFYSREASSSVRPYLEFVGLSGIEEENDSKTVSHILNIAVFPNPFYSVCNMTVPEGSTVEIFGMDGRRIYKVRSNGSKLIWKPFESVSSGIYFIRATLAKQTATRKIVCLRN